MEGTEIAALMLSTCIWRGVWNGATGVAREESEAVQNFLRGIWMNRGNDSFIEGSA
jgi:hypothetical protein